MAQDVIVIGGGVVGASAAYALARRGARVTLVDRTDAGQATAAGAGIVSLGTSSGASPALFALGMPGLAYFDALQTQLAEDSETATGYDMVGLLNVAVSPVEAVQLPDIERLFRERRDAGLVHIGAVAGLALGEPPAPSAAVFSGQHLSRTEYSPLTVPAACALALDQRRGRAARMAHRYSHPIAVTRGVDGMPTHFCWKGSEWPVSEVFETWHLMDRWWVRPTNPANATYSIHHGEQDRTYYRVCCRGPPGEQVFDLFHDAVTNLWMLDVAHD